MSSQAENPTLASQGTSNLKASENNNKPNEKTAEDADIPKSKTMDPLKDLEDRFRLMESRMNIIGSVLGPREAIGELDEADIHLDTGLPLASMSLEELRIHRSDEYDFWWDAKYLMRRIRNSYDHLQRVNKFIKEKKNSEEEAKAKSLTDQESEVSRKLSTDAFLKGIRIKAVQVDWDYFIFFREGLEESILAPIEIVSTEPEPQTILRLAHIKAKPTGHRTADSSASDKDQQSHGQRPLPERIKIHSSPLIAIFCKVMEKTEWHLAKDKSMVFLRPFRELVHYETKLREYLATLEKQFEGYDETHHSMAAPEEKGLGNHDNKNGDSEKHPEAGVVDQHDAKQANDSDAILGVEKQQDCAGTRLREKESQQLGKKVQSEERPGSITGLLHLRCLMDFFDETISVRLKHIESSSCTKITFHDIWHLFKPGHKVVDHTEKQAYVVLRVQTPRHIVEDLFLRWNKAKKNDDSSDEEGEEEEEDPVILHCAYIDFDGKQFGPVSKKFKIPQFGELKDVRSLPVYPFRYAKKIKLEEDLIDRGKMLLDVSRFKPMYYMGYTLDTRDEIDSQVVVDFNEALADEARRKKWEPTIAPINTAPEDKDDEYCMAPCCDGQAIHDGEYVDSYLTENFLRSLVPGTSLRAPSLLLSPRPLEDIPRGGEGLTDEELMVMTFRVFGFVLRSRKWAQLDLTFLRYEDADTRSMSVNAFERLELPTGHREMVKSLVIQHFRSKQTSFTKDEQTDLIKGKGKGLIMLLHGAPGVGKTTTAEGIAELFKKPLFQITCGDLGSTAREVETELERNFALASRWGCILLLDEADVFLSARDRMDFKRNGLVAVFLRVLEYYTGILFLTTNRIGDFDEAFASRVHMSLYYPELDEEKTLRVFELNLDLIRDRFKKQGREIIYDASSVEDFARQHYQQNRYGRWNGRQIRNLCQTALALAEFDTQGGELDTQVDRSIPVSLQLKYFKTVQAAYLGFSEYLGDVRGTKGDRRAVDYGLRARQDTPYQTRPSPFAQRAENMASQKGNENRSEFSSSSSLNYPQASQNDPFQPLNQGHMLSSHGTNISPQPYNAYAPQQPLQPLQNHYQQQQPVLPMDNPAHNMPPGLGYPGQGQSDPHMMQSQQSTTQHTHYQQGSQGPLQNMNVNSQGSPIPHNSFQGQLQAQRML